MELLHGYLILPNFPQTMSYETTESSISSLYELHLIHNRRYDLKLAQSANDLLRIHFLRL
ncbi:hypothetical protein D3C76_1807540 [compost metagenome]